MIRLQTLIGLTKPYYNSPDPAHDWAHVGRVAATAKILCKDTKAQVELTLAAVYCHDLVNLPKNHPDRKSASTLSAQEATKSLNSSGYSSQEQEIIKTAIVEHSFSQGLKPSIIEAAIVQDADRLDALGAIGILRCAAVTTQMKSSFYDPFDPMALWRPLDDSRFMVDHYYVKLFKLPELMNTEKGRQMALERIGLMKNFLTSLVGELRGLEN
jgi:uncharacterized protein